MVLTVEFLGHARRLVGRQTHELEIGNDATYGDLLRSLARAFPALSDEIIDSSTGSLTPAYTLMRQNLQPVCDFQEHPTSGECVILMFVEAGG